MVTKSDIAPQVSLSWMEHQAIEHIKRALRVTIEWQAPAISYERKRSSVSFAVKSFARHLDRLMAIEEEDGYMQMVADAKPNKCKRVYALREDHNRFRQLIAKLTNELDKLEDWQEPEFERICHDVGRLLDEVDEHDKAEIRLLQEAMLFDEGGGD